MLLRGEEPWALHLRGLYAHSVADFSAAAACFSAAEQARRARPACAVAGADARSQLCGSAPHEAPLRSLCGAQRALSLLCAGTAGCAGAAADALSSAPPRASFPAAAMSLFASALAALRRDAPNEAKGLLSRCLKAGHGELNNHELVGQSLIALGSLVLQQDGAQAQDMLMSAFTMGKAAGDSAAQAAALALIARKHSAAGAAGEAREMEKYGTRKRTAREAALAEAAGTDAHGCVLEPPA